MKNNQFNIFAAGVVLFIIIAAFGWTKLYYGFNFVDEGFHMTESWRIAAGDHFLDDKLTGSLRNYRLLNSLIFKSYPDIALLGFRKLQFFFTIMALALFGTALFLINKTYWYLPFIFSVFAFTGLDPLGAISNLNYYTYPHLFLTLHIAFLLYGLYTQSLQNKKILQKRSHLNLHRKRGETAVFQLGNQIIFTKREE